MFNLDTALGIAIQDDDLVLLTLAKGLGYRVNGYRVIERFRELETAELRSAIQHYLRNNPHNRGNVILGLPRNQVVVRQVELPLEVEENLREVAQFQVNKVEPNEDESSCFDYLVLERDEKKKIILLQITMVPQRTVNDLLQLFQQLGLYPAAIRLESMGLQQLLQIHRDGYQPQPSILIHVDDVRAEIVVAAGQDRCLAQQVSLPPGELSFDRLVAELDEFVPHLPLRLEAIFRIYLSGSGAKEFLPDFEERFGACVLLSKGLKLQQPSQALENSGRFLHALGLAISGLSRSRLARFNLIPHDRRRAGHRPSIVPTVALLGLLLVTLGAVGAGTSFQKQGWLNTLSNEVDDLRPAVNEVIQTRREIRDRLAEAIELKGLLSGRQRVLQVLKELSDRMPDDAYLQTLTVHPDKVNLTGYSENATSLLSLLRASESLKNISSRYITRDQRMGKEKFNFEAQILDPNAETLP